MDDDWVMLREGVWRRPLAVNSEKGIQADLIRIDSDFTDMPHVHDGFEWVYVLDGGFTDQAGEHGAGDFIVNSTEGVHQVSTGPGGCLLFIVWTGSVSQV
ncbi:MAG: cupin domain-containing protein [Candidatus Altiarchaeota archaeon]